MNNKYLFIASKKIKNKKAKEEFTKRLIRIPESDIISYSQHNDVKSIISIGGQTVGFLPARNVEIELKIIYTKKLFEKISKYASKCEFYLSNPSKNNIKFYITHYSWNEIEKEIHIQGIINT